MRPGNPGRAVLVLAAALASVSTAAIGAGSPSPGDRDVWITIGEPEFATVTDVLAPGPGSEILPFLPRLASSRGVVATRLPESALEALSERVHRDLGRCGGFVAHGSLEEALAELQRLESPPPALVLPFTIDRPELVQPLIAAVDEATILATITSLSTNFPNRYRSHPSGTNAANAIKTMWEGYVAAAGRPEITVALYSHATASPSTPQPSVVLTMPGSSLPQQIVVLGAHEDSTSTGCSGNPTCSAPGADDDASGVATISEALRVMLAAGFEPQRTLQFMAFAGEEGGLIGSKDIALDYQTAGTQVVAMLQQDMTAFEGSSTDVTIISDATHTHAELNQFLGGLIDTYLPTLTRGTSNCGYGCSDHASFTARGFPAAIAFEAPYPGSYNTALHTINDTVATFGGTAAHAAKFARIAVAFGVEASTDFEPNIFLDSFESEDTSAWSAEEP